MALAIILFLPALAPAYTLTVTASDQVRVGDHLKVLLQVNVQSVGENVTGIGCMVMTLDPYNNTVDGPTTYDSVLNEPPGLKTNAGGKAYYSMPLSWNYPTFANSTVFADCGGAVNQTQFQVLPASQTDQIAGLIFSLKDNGFAWIAAGLVLIFLVIFLGWMIKAAIR